jgi:hypothetical protein
MGMPVEKIAQPPRDALPYPLRVGEKWSGLNQPHSEGIFMAESTSIDLASFQAKVLEEIETLQLLVNFREVFQQDPDKLSASGEQNFDRRISTVFFKIAGKFNTLTMHRLRRDKKIDEYTQQGRAFLRQPETRQLLCPTLQSVGESLAKLKFRSTENDALEIATAITPLLWAKAQSASSALSPEPVLFALCAWMIARTGVNNYCAGV